MSGGITLDGRTFTVPSSTFALAGDERLAVAFFTGAAAVYGSDTLEHVITPGAVDLSLVRTGRAPLLMEHCHALECLIGQVVTAEIEGPLMKCLVRFARGGEADRIWGLLQDGFPLSISLGARIQHAEKIEDYPDGSGAYRATRWQLREISVCTFGKDQDAFVRSLGRDDDAAGMVARMAALDGDAATSAVNAALHLDRWRSWARTATPALAEELGADLDATGAALERAVAAHCDRLVRELALPVARA
jgi:HK97 family phage prohead protease